MKRLLLFISILVFGITSIYSQNKFLSFTDGVTKISNQSNEPVRTVKNLFSEGVEVEYKFSGANITSKEIENKNYNFIHIENLPLSGQIGAPALPLKNDLIALPKGSKPEITVIDFEFFEYSGYMIHPALRPATGVYGEPEPEFEIDSLLYSTNEFYPKKIVEVANLQHMRGTPLAYSVVRPVQFNPVTGIIRVYTKIKYKITFAGGKSDFSDIAEINSFNYTQRLKSSVLNYSSIPEGIKNDEINNKSGAKNYIIITHSEYINAANDLANWKRQMGYSAEVVSQSSWTTAQVKSAVADRYNAWTPKPDYFVIIGDHTGSYAIPGEIYNPPSASDDFATDLYYSCMDGGGDYVPDIIRGRISVRTAAEAQVVVDKIINYEKEPTNDVSFYNTATHCAMFQESATNGYAERRFAQTAEECKDYMDGLGLYTVNRVYKTESSISPTNWNNGYYSNGEAIPSYLLKPGFAWDGDKNDIKAEIDDGRFYLLHRDHGYTGGVGWADPEYRTSDISSLANGDMLPVIFSMNCHTGEYQLDNCFAEEFIRVENKGAVGVVAAAYYSISGYNDAIAIGMFDAIWPGFEPNFTGSGHTGTPPYPGYPEIFAMGDVLNQGLLRMTQSWGDSWGYEEYEYQLFHWFGDPAMKIWTSNPHNNPITASHPASVDCAGTTFAITGSTDGATATLVFNNELIGEVILDGSGNGTINYSISEPGSTVILTISKHNNHVYTTDLPLGGSCNFPPAVNTDAQTSVTENSATLNGEITDDYGSTVSESGFVYSTTSDPLIGGGGVTQIQTSPTVTNGIFNEGITGLTASTTYYYKAYAINNNGTSYGDEVSFTTLCGNFVLPYSVNFNSGEACWDGIGGSESWLHVTPTNVYDGDCFLTNGNNNYSNQSYILTSPSINFSGYINNQITFYMWMDVESNSSYYDGGFIECYDGSSWTKITNTELNVNYDGTLSSSYSNPYGGEDAYSADKTWTQVTITLPAGYDNVSNFKVRFKFGGDSSNDYPGWAIDDVAITGTASTPTATVSATPGCGTGSVTVSSDMSGTQTFYLRDNGGGALQDWTGDATSHEFAGLSDGDYKGQVEKGGDMSDLSDATTLTNNDNPTPPTNVTASPSTICSGDNSTLSYTGGSGDTFEWYSGSCGGTYVGNGNNLSVSPSADITYYGRWETSSCGNSSCQSVSITVNDIPAQPSSITGNTTPNEGASESYSVTNVSGTYTWSVPGDWTIDAGQGTNSLSVTVGSNSGDVSVTPSNSCGNGTSRSLSVTPVIPEITWDGSENSDWQTSANWSNNSVPGSADNITIPNGLSNYPVIDDGATTAFCANLIINSGATLTIAANGQMTVSGSITNSAGNSGLLINSDASGTGSLIHNTSGGVDATVEIFFAGSPRQWHFIGSPIDNAPVSILPSVNNLYFYDETTDDYWTGSENGSASTTGWTSIGSGNFINAKGYLYNYYENTLTYTGQLNDNTTTSSLNISYTDNEGSGAGEPFDYTTVDGYNLIANPYTAAIDWNSGDINHAAANVDKAVYYYNGTIYTGWVDGVSNDGGTQYIPAGQGVFVKANATGGANLNIPASALTHNTQSYWKETPDNFLRLQILSGEITDETVIRLKESATANFDGNFDAYKLYSHEDGIAQLCSSNPESAHEYSINSLSNFNDETVKIVNLKAFNLADNYQISASELNFEENTDIYLKDNFSNTTYSLKLNNTLDFNLSGTESEGRFDLLFEKATTSVLQSTVTTVSIYPNPANDMFNITVGGKIKEYKVEVLSVTGQVVYSNTFYDSYTKTVNMASIAQGVYFVNVKFNDGSTIFEKIVIE